MNLIQKIKRNCEVLAVVSLDAVETKVLIKVFFININDMELSKISSAVYNDIVAGLSGTNANPNISMEQLEDEVIELRETVIKDWYLKGILKPHDLMLALNCIEVNCDDPAKCCKTSSGTSEMHFEIPILMNDLGTDAIE
ncbi:MAG: hypothetical protein IJ193_01495 [Bacilli bacterium]|nr:hypothetical protein [Bacilli bacterium]